MGETEKKEKDKEGEEGRREEIGCSGDHQVYIEVPKCSELR